MVPKIRNYNNAQVLTGECINCGIKPIEYFPVASIREGKTYYRNMCHKCFLEKRKEYRKQNVHQGINYRKNNTEKISEYNKEYYEENKEQCSEWNKKNHIKYKEEGRTLQYSRNYIKNNRDKVNDMARQFMARKRKESLSFKINCDISRSIRSVLKKNNGSKDGNSSKSYLPFTFDELKEHLEKQFEPWMTWENRGSYNIETWDDNDPSTWTWQLDHIIPQSKLPYTNMEDDNFKKCWLLNNLRPLSAKINIKEGNRR